MSLDALLAAWLRENCDLLTQPLRWFVWYPPVEGVMLLEGQTRDAVMRSWVTVPAWQR